MLVNRRAVFCVLGAMCCHAACLVLSLIVFHCVMQRSNTFSSGSGGREVLLELMLLDAQLTLPRDKFGE